ncbi:BZ3500_MvSof-1268-A1-R1_Chr6-3g08846 [Microbotryum saponariae]|uniref:BZ3500_MvSof-1268-A1-R1_Chr5-2g07777 protein n=1 Tax=Microbotryum saponariae TaxID=289078 RepID=A0A2X0NNU9_9BASI|nr:BZ3500_MvSof-1268-A1-R1_Chr5-3g08297 [Microbotryum saponariae]SCZ92312.1 BZ3500_MvSof-1268-A1-R1_Chr5-2g07777 [Microbotryum saponariae]SCZ93727.1 BZ3500_MvSof-1268-A1-R1_Chr6-3g08846 [Microbotryum saponariae]SDA05646.1 BZ3501_MvSof-1269-A2-R1_Chr5-2g07599 [Microbotryum saponariae]SDA07447.1 BZ3501_MvSof-1269-A2-R1_Chr6-2g08549 [Microbotryum saponariae]
MVEQGGNNPDGTGIVFDAAGLPNTAPSARDRQKSRAAQVSQDEEGGRASGGRGNVETKFQWYSIILKELFQSALRRRSVLDGEKIQSPKFVYDVKALRDNARIIVQRGALLRKADFRSPSGKLKLLGPDLDRIIPLLRAGELSFRLEEEAATAMLTGGLGTRAPTRTASEVTMAELSAPARLVDAHAVRRSWLLKGQHSLDNTGHHNIYFKVLLHMHPALGD